VASRWIKILFILAALTHVAATCKGTECGNPGSCPSDQSGDDGDEGSPPADLAPSAIDELIDLLCQRINACDESIPMGSCVTALEGIDGNQIGDEFGLAEGEFTVEEIRNGLEGGTIIADDSALADCEADISVLPCDAVSSNVSADNFSNVENIIPASCLNVFSLSE